MPLTDRPFVQRPLPPEEIVIFTDETLPDFHRRAMRAVVITDQAFYICDERSQWQRFPLSAITEVRLTLGKDPQRLRAKTLLIGLLFAALFAFTGYGIGTTGSLVLFVYALPVLPLLARVVWLLWTALNTYQGTAAIEITTTTTRYHWSMPGVESTEADQFADWQFVQRIGTKLAELGVPMNDETLPVR